MLSLSARGAAAVWFFPLLSVAACSGDPTSSSACVGDLPAACSPLYTPTFDQIFERTLKPTCAVSGSSCHAPEGAKGGLVFDDLTSSYQRLLGQGGAEARVTPGDAACSLLIERLYATDPALVMPPGAPLGAAELCDFVLWINDGAKP